MIEYSKFRRIMQLMESDLTEKSNAIELYQAVKNNHRNFETHLHAHLASEEPNESLIKWVFTKGLVFCAYPTGGCQIIHELLTENPSYATLVTHDALYKPLPDTADKDAGLTAFSILSVNESAGAPSLNTIFDNTNLAQDMPAELLCAYKPENNGWHTKASALFWLSQHEAGQAILLKLLEANPSIASTITDEILDAQLPAGAGRFAGNSPRSFLEKTELGESFLTTLEELQAEQMTHARIIGRA